MISGYPESKTRKGRTIVLLLAFSVALGLQVTAIHEQSLSGDGAYHLVAGHQAVRYGQNLINLEHPPLAKLLIAMPLGLHSEPFSKPIRVRDSGEARFAIFESQEHLRWGTLWARYLMFLFFGIPLLGSCYALGQRFGGPAVGVVLTLMLAFSLSILPNFTVLQTDTAVSLAYMFTLLASFWLVRTGSFKSALVLGLAFGLALSVKYSGVLLAPTVVLAVGLAWRVGQTWWRPVVMLLAIGFVAIALLDLTYVLANLNYESEAGRETLSAYCRGQGGMVVADRMLPFEDTLLAVEEFEPRLAQWLTGLIAVHTHNVIGVYPSYIFGEISYRGRWWYFPVLLLLKTPLIILLAGLAIMASRHRSILSLSEVASRLRPETGLIIATAVVYLGAALTSNYNLGVRHLMPMTPLLFLPIAVVISRSRIRSVLVVGLLVLESLLLSPLWISATNTWWLGRHNPTRFALGSGNLEYGQNLIQLAKYVEKHEIEPLVVVFPSLGESVLQAYLPTARLARLGDPLETGWYAVNAKVEQFIPALLRRPPEEELHQVAQQWLPYWKRVRQGRDHGYVAATFHLYWVESGNDSETVGLYQPPSYFRND